MRALALVVTLAACGGEAPPEAANRPLPDAGPRAAATAAPRPGGGGGGEGFAPCEAADCNDDAPWRDAANPAQPSQLVRSAERR
jgi:hypothetical protein